ncbi:MAG: DUF386 domain-containing protein [Clostridiales bacterium]|nr:DUF386 domain-containing protein [Clostridiales bacterium]
MIFDTVENILKYAGISENFRKAAEFIASTDLASLAPGRYDIDGANAYCIIQEPDLKEKEEIKWEAHKNYADIQLGIEDGEGAQYRPLAEIETWDAYNPDWDMVYSPEQIDGMMCPIKKGCFAVFFPQDAHRPCIKIGENAKGHKAVIKVKMV